MARAIVVCAISAALALHTLAGAALSGAIRTPPQVRTQTVTVRLTHTSKVERPITHEQVDEPHSLALSPKEKPDSPPPSQPPTDASLDPHLDVYLPRSALTKSPTPTGSVFIEIPGGFPTGERYRSVVSLYIDEEGLVRKVEFSEPPLPEAIQTSVRLAFMQAQFQPGEVGGLRVKSLLHFEVTFDDGAPSQQDTATTGSVPDEPNHLSSASS